MSRPRSLAWFAVALLLWSLPVPTLARRAVAFAEAIAESSSANDATYTPATAIAIASGEAVVCHIGNTDGDGATETVTLAWTTGGEAWTSVGTSLQTDTNNARITAFTYASTHASSTIVASASGADAQNGWMAQCQTVTGADTASLVLQSKGAKGLNSTAVTLTLDSARTASSGLVATVMTDSSDCTIAGEGGAWTTGTTTTHATPQTDVLSEWDVGGSDTTPAFTLSVCANPEWVEYAVEVAVASGAATCRGALTLLGVGGC